VLGAFVLAGQIFDNQSGSPKTLITFSDMRHHTHDLDLETPLEIAAWSPTGFSEKLPVADLKDVQVYALAVDGAGKNFAYWSSLQRFWNEYFRHAGVHLVTYSVLREHSFRSDSLAKSP
jgi:hypothetical protein